MTDVLTIDSSVTHDTLMEHVRFAVCKEMNKIAAITQRQLSNKEALDAIVIKCLAPRPGHRVNTAEVCRRINEEALKMGLRFTKFDVSTYFAAKGTGRKKVGGVNYYYDVTLIE